MVPELLMGIFKTILEGADKILARGEELSPQLFCFRLKDNEIDGVNIIEIRPLMQNSMSKEFLSGFMNELVQNNRADIVIMLSEAWVAKFDANEFSHEDVIKMRAKDRPDKTECVLLNTLTKFRQIIGMADIIRVEDGTAKTNKLEILPTGGEGIFVRNEEDHPRVH